jgi:8-oxo-dGTP pyrophosphatase MutT (NUDIX family)
VRRAFSAGAVLVRRLRGEWMVAVIRPAGRDPGTWVLPKGLIQPGETGQAAALRELTEETGATGRAVAGLGRIEYWFSQDGERVLKTVSFFLVRYGKGRLGRLPPEAGIEVAEARWLPLAEGPSLLAYRGERETAARALEVLDAGHHI